MLCLYSGPLALSQPPPGTYKSALGYLEGLPARTAFLVLLCTGWSISGLQACVTLSDYCLITLEGRLRIRPHEAFLPTNELSLFRWPRSYISLLFDPNGSGSALYPVYIMRLTSVVLCLWVLATCSRLAQVPLSPFFMLSRLFYTVVLSSKLTLPLRLRSMTYEVHFFSLSNAVHGRVGLTGCRALDRFFGPPQTLSLPYLQTSTLCSRPQRYVDAGW